MNTAELVWITPNADNLIGYVARVSNASAKPEDDAIKLIHYLLRHKHFSPFELASACVEIRTTRDISRQILRHRSFHFQEFSQRYAEVDQTEPSLREARLQDSSNRQSSLPVDDKKIKRGWELVQQSVFADAMDGYHYALGMGIAKEQARALLPEGLTETKLYMSGTIRDWLHYLEVRCGHETQREHRLVAEAVLSVLTGACPVIFSASKQAGFSFGASPLGEGQGSNVKKN